MLSLFSDTHIFTFLFENPSELYAIEVRSNYFRFAGIDWYIYSSRSSADFISLYLRAAKMDPGVSSVLQELTKILKKLYHIFTQNTIFFG